MMLRNQILPATISENFDQIWFQQDGAASHYGREVRNYLNTVFPNRWISRRGRIEVATAIARFIYRHSIIFYGAI